MPEAKRPPLQAHQQAWRACIGILRAWRAEMQALWSRLRRDGASGWEELTPNAWIFSCWLKQNMWETRFPISLKTTLSPGFPPSSPLVTCDNCVSLDSLQGLRAFTFHQASYLPNPSCLPGPAPGHTAPSTPTTNPLAVNIGKILPWVPLYPSETSHDPMMSTEERPLPALDESPVLEGSLLGQGLGPLPLHTCLLFPHHFPSGMVYSRQTKSLAAPQLCLFCILPASAPLLLLPCHSIPHTEAQLRGSHTQAVGSDCSWVASWLCPVFLCNQ